MATIKPLPIQRSRLQVVKGMSNRGAVEAVTH